MYIKGVPDFLSCITSESTAGGSCEYNILAALFERILTSLNPKKEKKKRKTTRKKCAATRWASQHRRIHSYRLKRGISACYCSDSMGLGRLVSRVLVLWDIVALIDRFPSYSSTTRGPVNSVRHTCTWLYSYHRLQCCNRHNEECMLQDMGRRRWGSNKAVVETLLPW